MKKNFLALASLAVLFSSCGSEESTSEGLPSSTPKVVSSGDGSVVIDMTLVGPSLTSSTSALPATGTCKVPSIAMQLSDIKTTLADGSTGTISLLPSPMKYLVADSNELICDMGNIMTSGYKPIDFSQGDLKGLTCQELVADVPGSFHQEAGGRLVNECCELVHASASGGGYVQTRGVLCGGVTIAGALCSIVGEFMGWACLSSV